MNKLSDRVHLFNERTLAMDRQLRAEFEIDLLLMPEELKRNSIVAAQWHTAGDKRVCPLCTSQEGNVYPVDSPEWGRMAPPIHLGCRCILSYITSQERGVEARIEKYRPIDPDLLKKWSSKVYTDAEIREMVKAQPTAKETEELLKEALKLESVNLGKMEPEFRRELESLYPKLAAQYKSKLKRINMRARGNTFAGTDAMMELQFNPKYFENRKIFLDTISDAVKHGWLPKIQKDYFAKQIMSHEFAHSITYMEIERMAKTPFYIEIRKIKTRYVKHLNKLSDQVRRGEITKSAWRKEYNKIFISKYAQKDYDEFIAEAFSMPLSSNTPSPYSLEVSKLIKQYFGK